MKRFFLLFMLFTAATAFSFGQASPATDAKASTPQPPAHKIDKAAAYYHYAVAHMLFGGRAAFFPESGDSIRRSAEILRFGMIDVYPQLRDTRVEFVWGGTLDFAFDIMPHAGQMDGMYYAIGYAGHGVAMATYQGHLMARKIAGEKPENPFDGIPFPGAPLGMTFSATVLPSSVSVALKIMNGIR